MRLKGRDPVAALLDFARSHNVGHIVIGRSAAPGGSGCSSIDHAPAGRRSRRLRPAHRLARHRGAESMSLRLKLLLALVPLGLALVVVGFRRSGRWRGWGTESQMILRDNYRSVLAAQRMQESIERLDRAGDAADHRPVRNGRRLVRRSRVSRFDTESTVQEGQHHRAWRKASHRGLTNTAGSEFGRKLPGLPRTDRPRRGSKAIISTQLQPALGRVQSGRESDPHASIRTRWWKRVIGPNILAT